MTMQGCTTAGRKLRLEVLGTPKWAWKIVQWVKRSEVKRISDRVVEDAEGCCECCGADGPGVFTLEAYEIWVVDEVAKTQTLDRMEALCADCGPAAAFDVGSQRLAMGLAEHMAKVNQWSRARVMRHMMEAVESVKLRSRIIWTVDISWVQRKGVKLHGDPVFRV